MPQPTDATVSRRRGPLTEEQKEKRKNSRKANSQDALTNVDSQPDSAHVRIDVVKHLAGASSASVWRMVKRGQLPSPKKIGSRITAWNLGELRRALGL